MRETKEREEEVVEGGWIVATHTTGSNKTNSEFSKLLEGLHAKSSMAELSKIDRGDEVDGVKLLELFYRLYFRGSIIAMILMDKLRRKALLILAMSIGMKELLGVA
nr:probable plastidic glucose transporter 3 [Tanacetum cinerariifolium]